MVPSTAMLEGINKNESVLEMPPVSWNSALVYVCFPQWTIWHLRKHAKQQPHTKFLEYSNTPSSPTPAKQQPFPSDLLWLPGRDFETGPIVCWHFLRLLQSTCIQFCPKTHTASGSEVLCGMLEYTAHWPGEVNWWGFYLSSYGEVIIHHGWRLSSVAVLVPPILLSVSTSLILFLDK